MAVAAGGVAPQALQEPSARTRSETGSRGRGPSFTTKGYGWWWVFVGATLVVAGFVNALANLQSVPPLLESGVFYEILAFVVIGMALITLGILTYMKASRARIA